MSEATVPSPIGHQTKLLILLIKLLKMYENVWIKMGMKKFGKVQNKKYLEWIQEEILILRIMIFHYVSEREENQQC